MSPVFEDNPIEDSPKYFVKLLLPNVRNTYLFIHLIIQQMYTDFNSLSRFPSKGKQTIGNKHNK